MQTRKHLFGAWCYADSTEREPALWVVAWAEYDGDGWCYLPEINIKQGLIRITAECDEAGLREFGENCIKAADAIAAHKKRGG